MPWVAMLFGMDDRAVFRLAEEPSTRPALAGHRHQHPSGSAF